VQGNAVIVLELARPDPLTTPQELAQLAKDYVEAGADALAVRCDSNDTSSGLTDLFCVSQAVGKQVCWRVCMSAAVMACSDECSSDGRLRMGAAVTAGYG